MIREADITAIKEACGNYVGGFFANDLSKMASSVHPQLVKRLVSNETTILEMSREALFRRAGQLPYVDINKSEPLEIYVDVYDCLAGIACAKVTTNKMSIVDLIQLAKFQEGWKVVNVLWARLDAGDMV